MRVLLFLRVLKFFLGFLECLAVFFGQFVVVELFFELVDEILVFFEGLFELRIGRVEIFGEVAEHFGEFFEFFSIFGVGAVEEFLEDVGGLVVLVLFEGLSKFLRVGVFFHLGHGLDGLAHGLVEFFLFFFGHHALGVLEFLLKGGHAPFKFVLREVAFFVVLENLLEFLGDAFEFLVLFGPGLLQNFLDFLLGDGLCGGVEDGRGWLGLCRCVCLLLGALHGVLRGPCQFRHQCDEDGAERRHGECGKMRRF